MARRLARDWGKLALFLLVVFAAASGGWFFKPGTWYAALWKPAWTPPDWLFAPVWTVLYVMIAVAGWLIFSRPGTLGARYLWGVQLVLNGMWTWIFFGLHATRLALLDIAVLLLCIAAVIFLSYRRQPAVSWLFLPYLAWVAYASALNAAIALGNP